MEAAAAAADPPPPSPTPTASTSASEPPPLHIRTDPIVGRKFHASRALPAGTDLLGSCLPYACTIWKEFRDEVCAECWRYDCGRRAFLTRRDDEGLARDPLHGPATSAGLRFCDARCQAAWIAREGPGTVDLLRMLEAARQRRPPKAPATDPAEPGADWDEADIERAWDAVRARERSPKEVRKWAGVQLDDYETDMARYVLLALVRRAREDAAPSDPPRSQPTTNPGRGAAPDWAGFAALQANELAHVRSHCELLGNQIRLYQALKGRFGGAEDAGPAGRPAGLAAVVTIENVRIALRVDPGNSFGIWEVPLMAESECLGFAVYPAPSFFNHHCSPNVRKERDGRALRFVTIEAVAAGEELCISYGGVEEMDYAVRREELKSGWYFECHCSRCVAESGELAQA